MNAYHVKNIITSFANKHNFGTDCIRFNTAVLARSIGQFKVGEEVDEVLLDFDEGVGELHKQGKTPVVFDLVLSAGCVRKNRYD